MSKLQELLLSPPEHLRKVADVESADEVQLEKDFANLAFVFLRDRAPGLMPFLLGFEVVDREEDGSKAVGIFGFKVGDDYYYVPAFFVNNQIKGMDLLFSKATNSFIPLRETWINHILNKKPIQIGDTGNPEARRDFEVPDFRFMAVPPITKFGVAGTTIESIKSELKQAWDTLQTGLVDAIDKDPEFQKAWAGAISRLEKAPLPFEKGGSDTLHRFLAQAAGPRAVGTLMTTIGQNRKYAEAALEFYPAIETLFVTEFASKLLPEKQAAQVTVITDANKDRPTPVGEKERKRLVRDGFAVLDTRPTDKVSKLEDGVGPSKYTSPTGAGTFEMLLPDGSSKNVWVLQGSKYGKMSAAVVVCPESGYYFTAEQARICVKDKTEEKPNEATPFAKAVSIDKMEPGKSYTLINDKGTCTAPFRLNSVIESGGKRTLLDVGWKTYLDYRKSRDGTWGRSDRCSEAGQGCSDIGMGDDSRVEIASYASDKLAMSGQKVIVPSNWKALELAEKWSLDDKGRAAYEAFKPGCLLDLAETLSKQGIHELTVENKDDGLEYFIRLDEFREGPFNYKAATLRLVGRYGFDPDTTETLLKEALTHFKSKHLVKLAQSPLVGVSMAQPLPPPGYGDDWTGATITEPYMELQRGQMTGEPPRPNPWLPGINLGGQVAQEQNALGPGAPGMPEDAMALANQAAQTGQKQVFDHATLGGLARIYDVSAVLDEYMPELQKALDRVGRILFLFYWKNEEFNDRYGGEDMVEMEDLIRGVFKSFGDLVLKLKQKSLSMEDTNDVLTV